MMALWGVEVGKYQKHGTINREINNGNQQSLFFLALFWLKMNMAYAAQNGILIYDLRLAASSPASISASRFQFTINGFPV